MRSHPEIRKLFPRINHIKVEKYYDLESKRSRQEYLDLGVIRFTERIDEKEKNIWLRLIINHKLERNLSLPIIEK